MPIFNCLYRNLNFRKYQEATIYDGCMSILLANGTVVSQNAGKVHFILKKLFGPVVKAGELRLRPCVRIAVTDTGWAFFTLFCSHNYAVHLSTTTATFSR